MDGWMVGRERRKPKDEERNVEGERWVGDGEGGSTYSNKFTT